MSLNELLDQLSNQGITLMVDGEQLRVRARQGVLTPGLRDQIAERKHELIELLKTQNRSGEKANVPQIQPDPDNRNQSFPLTDIQHAYWIGRDETLALGNTAVHAYIEIEQRGTDIERLGRAWRALVQRHDMLRMVIDADGRQRVLESVPDYQIDIMDLRHQSRDVLDENLNEIRKAMSHQMLPTDRWPLFDIRATLYESDRVRLHLSLDILVADLWSLFRLFSEWQQLYEDPGAELPALTISFRDYVMAEQALRSGPAYQRARDYWVDRLDNLPPAPDLPLAQHPEAIDKPQFVRRSYTLDESTWGGLKKAAQENGITPSGLLLSAFSEVLALWSKNPAFSLNLTLFNRLDLHPEVNRLVGDFTTTILLSVDSGSADTFIARARAVQTQLYSDLEYREFSGVQVMRELAHRRGGLQGATMPIVFSSALGLAAVDDGGNVDTRLGGQLGEVAYTITQTPQVWLDHQVFEYEGALQFNWDAVEALFPSGMLDAMFEAYCELLQQLASRPEMWNSPRPVSAPRAQLAVRAAVNATEMAEDASLLHEAVFQQAARTPGEEALIDGERRMSYAELVAESHRLAHRLRDLNVQPNTLVAVFTDQGWQQVVAVLAILEAGGAYLPIDTGLPEKRRNHLLEHGEVSVVVSNQELAASVDLPQDIDCVCLDQITAAAEAEARPLQSVQPPQDLAYVIYTSGSTGEPKGVMIEHAAAVNTLVDINRRYAVGPQDRILAVSSLSFDLSVYDIFGVLSAGGTLVFPDTDTGKDASLWWKLIQREKITLWNSVPALFQMLIDHVSVSGQSADCSLRLAMLSGDWIPLNLPERSRACWPDMRLFSQGGATEASIWSIVHPIEAVDPEWQSIPYGKPLGNQRFHVLNKALDACPDWVTGQLYIGGSGLARGYWRDAGKTAASFIVHPQSGERLYKTGDLGRYRADGAIEFQGREDFQVKVNGYRIELGEIETALLAHPQVDDAVVIAHGERLGEKRLVAYIVCAADSQFPSDIDADLKAFVQERLPGYMVPSLFMQLTKVPLTANGKVDRGALPAPEKARVITQASARPESPEQIRMVKQFAAVLKLDDVGIHDSFFELGGDSLQATRLVAAICKEFSVDIQLRDLFQGPSVAELSARVGDRLRQSRSPNGDEPDDGEEEGTL